MKISNECTHWRWNENHSFNKASWTITIGEIQTENELKWNAIKCKVAVGPGCIAKRASERTNEWTNQLNKTYDANDVIVHVHFVEKALIWQIIPINVTFQTVSMQAIIFHFDNICMWFFKLFSRNNYHCSIHVCGKWSGLVWSGRVAIVERNITTNTAVEKSAQSAFNEPIEYNSNQKSCTIIRQNANRREKKVAANLDAEKEQRLSLDSN